MSLMNKISTPRSSAVEYDHQSGCSTKADVLVNQLRPTTIFFLENECRGSGAAQISSYIIKGDIRLGGLAKTLETLPNVASQVPYS